MHPKPCRIPVTRIPMYVALTGASLYVLVTLVGMTFNERVFSARNVHKKFYVLSRDALQTLRNASRAVESMRHELMVGRDRNFSSPLSDSESGSDKGVPLETLLQHVAERWNDTGRRRDGQAEFYEAMSVIRRLVAERNGSSGQRQSEATSHRQQLILERQRQEDMLRQLPLEESRFPSNIDNVPVNKLPFLKDTSLPKSTCPKTLRSISRTSRWFGERFMEDIKLFSDYDDIRSYQNFHKLQHYRLPFGYRGVDRKQLAAMTTNSNFTNLPLFLLEERPQCLRCAVVGSGGILNGSNAGVEIDSHDLVFRLNRGLAGKRFARDVGEKTSVYVFFPESLYPSAVKDKDTLAVFAMFKQYDVDYAEHMVREIPPPLYKTSLRNYTLPKPPVPASRLKLLHPDFARYVFTRFLNGKSFRPTTGALVTLLAIQICDEVTVYGFGYDPRFTLHFYDNVFVKHTKASTGAHDVDNERELWKKMHEEGIIRLYRRDC